MNTSKIERLKRQHDELRGAVSRASDEFLEAWHHIWPARARLEKAFSESLDEIDLDAELERQRARMEQTAPKSAASQQRDEYLIARARLESVVAYRERWHAMDEKRQRRDELQARSNELGALIRNCEQFAKGVAA